MIKRSYNIFFAVLVLCIWSLSGCHHSPGSGNEVNIAEPMSKSQLSQGKTLTFFAPVEGKSSGAVSYRRLIDRYNKSHEVHVVFEGIATADGYNEYLEERLKTGKGDDIFIVNEDSVKTLAHNGHFYDLSSLEAFEKLNDSAREEAVIGDTVYCIPMNMTAYALFVNMDVLAGYGLEAPDNLEEFKSCCTEIKALGGTPISLSRWHATAVPTIAGGLYKLYGAPDFQNQLELLNSGEALIGDYMVEGFKAFQTAVENGWYGDGVDGDIADALRAGEQDISDFVSGRTAFYFGPLEYIPLVEEANPQPDYHVQGIPVPGGTALLTTAVSRLCVNPHSENLDEAMEFVSYLSSEYYKESMKNGTIILPVYKSSDFTLSNEKMRPAYETYESGIRIPAEDMHLKFGSWDVVRELCLEMFTGLTAEEAAEEYNKIQLEQISGYDKQEKYP